MKLIRHLIGEARDNNEATLFFFFNIHLTLNCSITLRI